MPSQPMIPRDAEDLRFRQGRDNETDDTFASANVCSGARCCLFNSSTRFGLLLSRTVLPVPLPGSLLPMSLRRALLSAPRLACRGLWSPWILSLLVGGLTLQPTASSLLIELALLLARLDHIASRIVNANQGMMCAAAKLPKTRVSFDSLQPCCPITLQLGSQSRPVNFFSYGIGTGRKLRTQEPLSIEAG